VAAVALALTILGVPVLALQAPFVTSFLVGRAYDPASAGLPPNVALRTAEAVRVYTTDPRSPRLPAVVGERPGFDESAESHLRDVRRVLTAARVVTLGCAALLALLLALVLPARRYRDIAWVSRAGAVAVAGVTIVAGAAAVIDFEAFFGFFHGLFFSAGTWTFPPGTLLIELFPEPVWAAFGGLWAAGVLLLAGSALLAARGFSRSARSLEGEDV
jgi:hypothetical protein